MARRTPDAASNGNHAKTQETAREDLRDWLDASGEQHKECKAPAIFGQTK